LFFTKTFTTSMGQKTLRGGFVPFLPFRAPPGNPALSGPPGREPPAPAAPAGPPTAVGRVGFLVPNSAKNVGQQPPRNYCLAYRERPMFEPRGKNVRPFFGATQGGAGSKWRAPFGCCNKVANLPRGCLSPPRPPLGPPLVGAGRILPCPRIQGSAIRPSPPPNKPLGFSLRDNGPVLGVPPAGARKRRPICLLFFFNSAEKQFSPKRGNLG